MAVIDVGYAQESGGDYSRARYIGKDFKMKKPKAFDLISAFGMLLFFTVFVVLVLIAVLLYNGSAIYAGNVM